MRKKRSLALFLALLFLLLPGCSDALLNSNLVSGKKMQRLQERADLLWADQDEKHQIGEAQTVMEYQDSLSYLLQYPKTGRPNTDARILAIVQDIRNTFDMEYLTVEGEAAEGGMAQKKQEALLTLRYETYLADSNQLSVVFFETHETEETAKTPSAGNLQISIFHFDLEKDKELTPEELMWSDFRKNASLYTIKYFTQTEPYRRGLFGNYAVTLSPEAGRFDRFAFTQDGALFYFDQYDIFPGSYGLVSLLIPYAELQTKTPPPQEETPQSPDKENDSIDANKPMVALTFDDGPHPVHTNAILDTLEKYNAVATFFDLGSLVQAHPTVVQREIALGCEVGSHSYDHKNFNKLSKEAIAEDIKKTSAAFQKALGTEPTLFRPPYGNCDKRVQNEISQAIVLWSVDTLDWKSRNAQSVLNVVKKEGNLDGKVILMHGIYGSSAEATALLVPYLQEQGYQLVTVSQLIEARHGETPQGGKLYGYSYFQ